MSIETLKWCSIPILNIIQKNALVVFEVYYANPSSWQFGRSQRVSSPSSLLIEGGPIAEINMASPEGEFISFHFISFDGLSVRTNDSDLMAHLFNECLEIAGNDFCDFIF
jgi:hypothetical protein